MANIFWIFFNSHDKFKVKLKLHFINHKAFNSNNPNLIIKD